MIYSSALPCSDCNMITMTASISCAAIVKNHPPACIPSIRHAAANMYARSIASAIINSPLQLLLWPW